jgi:UDP-N-acetylmuramate dehydrogenase
MLLYKSGNLRNILNKDSILERVQKSYNFTFAAHTTYCLGGGVRVAYFPENLVQAKAVFDFVNGKKEKFVVLGNGSNILASDKFFDGSVICLKRLKGLIRVDENTLFVLSGTSVKQLLDYCLKNNLSGLEYLFGIPATIGGIAAMNGGAGGKYISENIKSVMFYNGKIVNLPNKNCHFTNKHSTMRDINGLILGVYLSVVPNYVKNTQANNDYYKAMRSRQPKGKSCGCVFKNCGSISSGKLIDLAGLKGESVGLAYVSSEHANFIINRGDSAFDVYKLIKKVKEEVFKKFGILLQEEVVFVGDFED